MVKELTDSTQRYLGSPAEQLTLPRWSAVPRPGRVGSKGLADLGRARIFLSVAAEGKGVTGARERDKRGEMFLLHLIKTTV